MNKKIKEFSTGMKEKLRVLAAITHRARLLIMDEPTAGLDVEARNEILDMLRAYMAEDEKHSIPVVFADDIVAAIVILTMVFFVSFFMIPAQMEFGNEKSRIMTFGVIGVIAVIGYLCEVILGKKRLYQVLAVIDNMNVVTVISGIIVITFSALFVSYQISRCIMEKKEF